MTGIIIQARLGSKRLPRKIFRDIPEGSGISILQRCYDGVKNSKVDKVIITTPDEEVVDWCVERDIEYNWYRGKRDVLNEFYATAMNNNLDIIVRITADCIFHNSDRIDRAVKYFVQKNLDYFANLEVDGMDIEVIGIDALTKAWYKATKQKHREHIGSYFTDNRGKFKTEIIPCKNGEKLSIDTLDDYKRVSRNWETIKYAN